MRSEESLKSGPQVEGTDGPVFPLRLPPGQPASRSTNIAACEYCKTMKKIAVARTS
jgi:hypothetical protein